MTAAADDDVRWLQATPLLDFDRAPIRALVTRRGWQRGPRSERIGGAYDFVRNEVAFGYNDGDELPASAVLADGIGQCNTKSTLLMALLRAAGVPCRLHGATIDKPLQRGAITGPAYWLAPQRIVHTWVEAKLDERWVALEGCILDAPYLASVQRRFPGSRPFCGYGVATPDLAAPAVEWRGQNTCIQQDGIADDFGVFDSPDAFYARHGSNLGGLKRWVFRHIVRHWMNANVRRVRAGQW